jgi:hypothetical protein
MIVSVERNILEDVVSSLKEKLRYIERESYLEYAIRSAKSHVEMALLDMKRYENHINFVENRQKPTCNCVEKQ